MITLKLPESLYRFSNQPVLVVNVQRLCDFPSRLKEENLRLHDIIFDSEGQISGFLNIYLDQQRIANFNDTTPLSQPHTLEIITALSGG